MLPKARLLVTRASATSLPTPGQTKIFTLQQRILNEGERTIDPVLTCLDSLLFKMKKIFVIDTTSYLREEVNCTETSPSVGIPRAASAKRNKIGLFL